MKSSKLEQARKQFEGTCIQITVEGERHLGAVIGSVEYKETYVKAMVNKWEINLLSDIAVTQPEAAYMYFVDGYKNKFTYFLRTIFGIEEFLTPLDEFIRHKFIPAVTGGHIVNDNERKLLALPPRLGGLGIDVFCKNPTIEYGNSRNMTASLRNQILMVNNEEGDKSKQQIQSERREDLEALRAEMTDKEKRIN